MDFRNQFYSKGYQDIDFPNEGQETFFYFNEALIKLTLVLNNYSIIQIVSNNLNYL